MKKRLSRPSFSLCRIYGWRSISTLVSTSLALENVDRVNTSLIHVAPLAFQQKAATEEILTGRAAAAS
ncbi:hypothetical protein ALQ91_200018 [Pseudomonas syringae pv. syringae]|nr:hypothetical protein ALQ91_200018 [Pseudomonas syringae pv. syringae]